MNYDIYKVAVFKIENWIGTFIHFNEKGGILFYVYSEVIF